MSALTYGSVCSGIEAASVAWAPLGWEAAFVSEIEAAPRAVLQHRFPEVPLHGDFTTIQAGDYRPIQLLVGGTPCQSFSVAGLRGGLADDRGNLALQFLRLADRLRPRWLVWENVPGVLSSNGGRDLGAILGGLVELGYGFAYRVLDAQYVRVDGFGRAVPQRRRRVFVVGYLGDWRRPAAVLLERACLRGDPAPRREAGAGTAVGALAGTGPGGGWRIGPDEAAAGQLVAAPFAPAISASNPYGDHESREGPLVAHSLRGEGFDAGGQLAVAFSVSQNSDGFAWESDISPTLQARTESPESNQFSGVRQGWSVRRLTPTECERLQGFPDGWTAVPWRGGIMPDGPRYKMLGNSMAVNCMRWIGRRIEAVEASAPTPSPDPASGEAAV